MNKPLRQLLGRLLSGLTRGTPTHPTPQHEKTLPEPPCGDPEEHYYWVNEGAMPCPKCRAIEVRKRELEEEDRILRKLAKLIASEMKNNELDT